MATKVYRSRDLPGHKLITMNGVGLEIMTRKAADDGLISRDERYPLGGGRYLYLGDLTRDRLYKAAGYDTNRIDFAVPWDAYTTPAALARREKGDQMAWSYAGKGRLLGKPVWDSEALKRLRSRINQRMKR